MLKITNGRISGVPFVAANSSGGDISPSLIILHDTAGRLDAGNSVAWFRSKECKTSAHVVVERDGAITQMVALNKKAFHAGQSVWRGKQFCNSFSIGIEIVNPGALDKDGRAWFHRPHEQGFPVPALEHKKTAEHGDAWWMPYTQEQLSAVKSLCRAIVEEYPDCNEIVTHWLVSPGRKVDTNPLMPLEEVRAYAFGFDDMEEEHHPSIPVVTGPPPPKTIAHSTETQTAGMTGAGGGFTLYQGTQNAVMRAASTGQLTARAVALAMLSEPLVWAGITAVFGSIYWFFKRKSRFVTEGK